MISRLNGRQCFIAVSMMFLSLLLFAEETQSPQKVEPVAQAAQKADAAGPDIWEEVTFGSGKEFELSNSKIQSMLDEIRRTDPQKAGDLEKLRNQDPKKFLETLRQEIGTALQPKATQPAASETPTEWQEQIQRRYAFFMDWFAKEFPADHTELLKLKNADTEKYVQKVIDTMAIYEPIQRTQKYNPQLADVMKQDLDLQKKRDVLLLQMRTAGSDEQLRLQKQLEQLVATRFDIIVKKKELQYESLRKRLERLSQQLDQQALELENLKKNKAQTVESHIQELLTRSEKVNW